MRLVVTGGTRSVRGWLEGETHEEKLALDACAARGEWTNGRGAESITTLRALADRLGYPVEAPNRAGAASAPSRLVVVRRGESALFERLSAIARDDVAVVWDRRVGERRTTDQPPTVNRREQDRRRLAPETWATLRFLVDRTWDAP